MRCRDPRAKEEQGLGEQAWLFAQIVGSEDHAIVSVLAVLGDDVEDFFDGVVADWDAADGDGVAVDKDLAAEMGSLVEAGLLAVISVGVVDLESER